MKYNPRRQAIACAMAYVIVTTKKTTKKRSKWVKKWIARRNESSHMLLLKELQQDEPNDFRNYLRMDSNTFRHLLSMVEVHLKKNDTIMRESISSEQRLVATLRFLATGRSYEDLKFSTRIAAQTLGYIIPETCKVIFDVLKEKYMKFPTSKDDWKGIAAGFKNRWQMINCGGAIDGKHIRIQPPPNSGALYYNYKNFYSVVLMAIVNSNYEFIYVDVGKQGRISDGGILSATTFYDLLVKNKLKLPTEEETDENLNFVFIGDEAFALHKHILKPYSQKELTHDKRIFNYRLSRSRNVVENTFGFIASIFRILHTRICVSPENINYIILAICALHNYLRNNASTYVTATSFDKEDRTTGEIIDGDWRNDISNNLTPLRVVRASNSPLEAKTNRDAYLKFFRENGRVEWQDKMVRRGKA